MDRASLKESARGELLAWLGDQLEEERFAQLDRAGHDPNDRIPLARVLVDLPIARSPLAEKKDDAGTKNVLAALCQEDPELFQRLSTSPQRGARGLLELEDMVDPGVDEGCAVGGTTGIVLVGGPGQGKSTITQSLCALHHAAWLSPHIDRLSVPAAEAVESIAAAQRRVAAPEGAQASESTGRHEDFQSSAPPLPTPATLRFPLRIVLPEAAAWLHSRKGTAKESLPSLLFFAAERAANVPVSVATLAAILGEADWLLILDGLDEVPASEARSAVLSAARALIDWLRERRPSGLVVATTRPQGYSGELDRWAELQTWYLLPLGVDDARKYAGHLVRARYDGKRGERILTRLSEAAASAATARLLRTPLQTTILVALIARIGRAPGERWSLFSEYYRIIYEREMERDLPAAELLRRYRPFIDRIHAHVGLLLQVEAELSEGTDATMTPARLRDVMHAVFAEQGMDAARRQGIIDELLKAITERLVLLVERRAGHVGFEIRPLQEMMAAWALGQKEGLIEERLLRVAKSDAHREVVLFIASKAFAELSDVRDVLVDRVLPALNEDPEEPLAAQVLRGSVLAIGILRDGAVLSQPKYLQRLVKLAAQLMGLPMSPLLPGLVAVCLADAEVASWAAPVLLEVIIEHFSADEAPEARLGAWIVLIAMADAGDAEADELGRRQWPLDTALQGALPDLVDYTQMFRSTWLRTMVSSSYWRFRPVDLIEADFLSQDVGKALEEAYDDASSLHLYVGSEKTGIRLLLGWRSAFAFESTGMLAHLASLEPTEPDWQMVVASARFLLEPGAAGLAAALEYLTPIKLDAAQRSRLQYLPWPLAACLSMIDSTESAEELARRARALDLGDAQQWRVAEQNALAADSTELTEILRAPGIDWPAKGVSLGQILPLAIAQVSRLAGPDEEGAWKSQDEVAALIGWLRDPRLPAFLAPALATIIWKLVWVLKSRGAVVRLSLEDALLLRPLDRTALWGWLEAIAPSIEPTEDWFNALDEIGRSLDAEDVLETNSALHSLPSVLATGFETAPHRIGLLHLLVRFAALGLVLVIPEDFLATTRFADPRDHDVALLLRIAQGSVSPEEAESAGPSLVAGGNAEDSLIAFLARIALRGPIPNTALPLPLFRGLLRATPVSMWQLRAELIAEARRLLGQAPTGLDDPAVWDTLQLPMPRPERGSVSDRAPESPVERRPIVIDKLSLHNFRGIEALQLRPSPPENGHGQWIILLGQNGLGKTTILRALVLSLFDLENAVRRPLPPTAYNSAWRRIGASRDDPAFVRLRLRGKELEHGVDLRPRDDLLWREDLRPVAAPPVEEMVFAYGVRRRYLVSDLSRAVGPELHALVPSLFEEGADLVPIEESLSPLEAAWHTDPESVEGRIHVELREALKELLHVDAIERRGQDLWVRGENIGEVPLKELSDGYLTLASWVVDLVIRWWNQAKRWKWRVDPAKPILESMTGLVLIDEIDLFLHPNWQRSVVKTLKKLLPRMSFVVTTHNPLAILGARANEIWILRRGEGGAIRAEQRDQEPFRLTGSDLYDLFFGIESTLPDEIGQMLYRYRQLASDPYRSPAEDAEANKLLSDLREREMDPGYEPMPIEDVPPLPENLR